MVKELGFRTYVGLRVQDSGFRVWGLGFRVLMFRAKDLRFRV